MPCWADRMRTKFQLLNLVFKPLRARREGNRRSVRCRLCGVEIHCKGYSIKVLFKHINIKHRSVLLGKCFTSITPSEWLRLFEYVPAEQGEVYYQFIRCKCCGEQFRNLYSHQTYMINHLKADHPGALLSVWRL